MELQKSFGKVDDVIKDYKNFLSDKDVKRLSSNNISKKYGDLIDELNDIEDLYFKMYCQNETVDVIETHSPVSIKCMFNLKYPVHSLNLSFVIYSLSGDHITTITTLNDKGFNKAHNKKVTLEINIPDFNLNLMIM